MTSYYVRVHDIPSFTIGTVRSAEIRVPTPMLGNIDTITPRNQGALDRFLETSRALVEPTITSTNEPLALSLHIGLGTARSPLKRPSLVKLATLLADRIRTGTGTQFAYIHCTKTKSNKSYIAAGPAVPKLTDMEPDRVTLTTRQSYARPIFSEEILEATSQRPQIIKGPVALTLSFVTGFPRTWSNLWQPTVRGLEPILGVVDQQAIRHVDEDRVVDLKINHASIGEILRHKIQITVAAETIDAH